MRKTEMGFIHAEINTEVVGLAVVVGQIKTAIPQLRKAAKRQGKKKQDRVNYFTPQ